MPPFLSFIVPCYNVAPYVLKCIESISRIGLARYEYEVLVVDDGSTDNGAEVVHNFAHTHPELPIELIRQENQGLGGARNTGIEAARGEYLWFVDSDDALIPEEAAHLIARARRQAGDVIYFNFKYAYADGRTRANSDPKLPQASLDGSYPAGQFYARFHSLWANMVWRALYRRTLFTEHRLRFSPRIYFEDIHFLAQLLCVPHTATYLHYFAYLYFIREDSILHHPQKERRRLTDRLSVGLFALAQAAQPGIEADIKAYLHLSGCNDIRYVVRRSAVLLSYKEFMELYRRIRAHSLAVHALPRTDTLKARVLMRLFLSLPAVYRLAARRLLPAV